MSSYITLLITAVVCWWPSVESKHGWDYKGEHGEGCLGWHHSYKTCAGDFQSPIDIDTDLVKVDTRLEPFFFSGYEQTRGVHMKLKNSGGHTAKVYVSGPPMYLGGGSLPAQYQLAQFHFHWGGTNTRGSDHTINGMAFPMEMHLVHTRPDLTTTDPQGLAVIGVFFEIGEHNDYLDPLLMELHKITNPDSSTPLYDFSVLDLLPDMEEVGYFRYDGGTTTPPCSESVIWSLLEQSIPISEKQLNMFRTLRDADGRELSDNFRPTQPLNGRIVTSSAELEEESDMD